MIIIHTMNMQRITISLPEYLYQDLVRRIPVGKVSSFVARVLERGLIELDENPIREFVELRKKLPRKKKIDIIEAIKKGRA